MRQKLVGQPFQVLRALLERPGEVVTRDELRQRLWPDNTFVDYELALKKAVNRLREVLGDNAQSPRFIETIPRHGYRFIGPVTPPSAHLALEASLATVPTEAPRPLPGAKHKRAGWLWRLVAGFAVVAVCGMFLWLNASKLRTRIFARSSPSGATIQKYDAPVEVTTSVVRGRPERSALSSQRVLTRLTFDTGLQFGVTWSRDGRFIAYSSDRGGKFDIWVQKVGGTNPVKVTSRPGHNWQPDWSPDGKWIAFRSEGEGGGLFVVPVLGGPDRRISSFGYAPRWSPDGSQILFRSTYVRQLWNRIFTVTLDGTPPVEILTEFLRQVGRHGRSVAWHPDSKRISVWTSDPHLKTSLDFWTVPLSGTEPLKSEVAPEVVELLKSVSFEDGGPGGEFLWAPSGRAVYFEGTTRGVQNLWKATVDPRTLRWLSLERVTTGPGSDTDFGVSPDGRKLAFTVRAEPTRILSYEFDAGAGRISGGGQPVSPSGVSAWMPDLSRDGKRLVFTTERNGKQELWEKSLSDGREALLFADDYTRKEPRWSPDGTRLEYLRFKPGSCQYILLRENGSDEEVLASDSTCESRPYDWSRDGKWVVSAVFWSNKSELQGNASAAWLLPISAAPHAEARRRLLMKGGQYGIYQMRFSPDGRSIVFEAVNLWGATNATLWVVPTSGGQWIPITDGKSWDDKPRWSPDGKAIYFISSRSGFLNVWGIRFDPVTQVPLGDPFRVTAFESPAQGVPERMTPLGMSLTENRLVLPISEASGSIWMLEDVNP